MKEDFTQPYLIGGETYSLKISLGAVVHDAYYQQPSDLLVAASKAVKEMPAGEHTSGG